MRKLSNLSKIHEEAIREFAIIQSTVKSERLQCLQDRRFYSITGASWEGSLGEQFENKPKFEVNKIHLAIIRIFNEWRNNRITVSFIPKDGSNSDELSETCQGLYRADEQYGAAEEAHDNAFEEAVGGGFGAWRLRAEYEDEDDDENDHQRICIEPIFDADSSVFFDLDAKRQDKSDAKRCYVLTSMTHSAYESEYGDNPSDWPKLIRQSEFDWVTPNVVYIAEYYCVEKTTETILTFKGLDGSEQKFSEEELNDDPDQLKMLEATGFKEVRQKKIKRNRVHKYILNGNHVIEDAGYIAGRNIPIVPVYGKRWFIDNIERCMGHVRLAKDAQRLKNMQLSKLGEISALSTIEKPIFTPEQMAGHAVMWSEDNIKNYPYLLLNAVTDQNGQPVMSGPVGYTKPPQVSPAMGALLQLTETDIQDVLGNQQAGEQLNTNMSGVAVELIQNKLDMQTYIYISNMSKAVKRSGEIWLSMAKDIFIEEGRKMKTVDGNGKSGSVEIARPVINEKTGKIDYENDLSKANFDIAVDVGPTSNSKRAATVRGLTGMMQITQDPETLQVLGAMTMMNMEGEGIGEVRDYFRSKLVKMGVVKPTDEEAKELQAEAANQQPDSNAQYLKAAADQAEAQATKAKADSILAMAKAEQTRADTAKAMADMDNANREHVARMLQSLQAQQAQQAPQIQQQAPQEQQQ